MKFWKNNRIDEEYELTFEQVAGKFFASPIYLEWEKNRNRNFNFIVNLFIASPEKEGGLQSVYGEEPEQTAEFERLIDYLYDLHKKREKTNK